MSLPKTWTPLQNSFCLWSPSRSHRYSLVRLFADVDLHTTRACIGLNPSTADELRDDRTVRAMADRSHTDGFTRFVMLNLFAWRATDPRNMKRAAYPVGKENDKEILAWCDEVSQVVLCWGNHGLHLGRSAQVLDMLRPYADKLYHFGLTKSGQPKHPLYLPRNTPLVKWEYPT